MWGWGDQLCDVRHCTEPCFVKVDGIAHCPLHFEIMWDRWCVPWDSLVREHFDDVVYRYSMEAQGMLYAEAMKKLYG